MMKCQGCHGMEESELLRGCEKRNLLWLKDVHLGAASDKDTMSHLSLLSSISQWNANVTKSTHFTYSNANLEETLLFPNYCFVNFLNKC